MPLRTMVQATHQKIVHFGKTLTLQFKESGCGQRLRHHTFMMEVVLLAQPFLMMFHILPLMEQMVTRVTRVIRVIRETLVVAYQG